MRHAESKRLRQDWNRLVQCWNHEIPPNLSWLIASGRREGLNYVSLGEMACRPARLHRPEWDDGKSEEALAVELRGVLLRPCTPLAGEVKLTATVGVHAIARRYERGEADDDQAVLDDVFKLAQAWPAHSNDRPGEFRAGLWAGFVGGVDRSLNGRTWLSGGPELFVDETGALRARWVGAVKRGRPHVPDQNAGPRYSLEPANALIALSSRDVNPWGDLECVGSRSKQDRSRYRID